MDGSFRLLMPPRMLVERLNLLPSTSTMLFYIYSLISLWQAAPPFPLFVLRLPPVPFPSFCLPYYLILSFPFLFHSLPELISPLSSFPLPLPFFSTILSFLPSPLPPPFLSPFPPLTALTLSFPISPLPLPLTLSFFSSPLTALTLSFPISPLPLPLTLSFPFSPYLPRLYIFFLSSPLTPLPFSPLPSPLTSLPFSPYTFLFHLSFLFYFLLFPSLHQSTFSLFYYYLW